METTLDANATTSDAGKTLRRAMAKAQHHIHDGTEAIRNDGNALLLRKGVDIELRASKRYVKHMQRSDLGALIELARINDVWTTGGYQYKTLITNFTNEKIEELKANGLLTELKIGRQSYYHLSDAGQSVYDAFKHYIPTSNIAMANGIPANVKTRIFGRYARSEKLTASILSVGGSLVITIQLFYEHLTSPNIPLYAALPFTMLIGGFVGGLAALHMHYAKRYEKAAEGVQDAAGLQTVHADRL